MAAACAPLAATHAQVTLTEIKRFNLDTITSATISDGSANSRYVGNSVNSVAWNGSRLFVAGFVNSALAGYDNQGIIEILNTATTGIVTSGNVQYGNRFGSYPGVNQLGYTGLTLSGNRLFASSDLQGYQSAANIPGVAGYDISVSTPSQIWRTPGSTRGSVHVSMDPGYVVSGSSLGGSGVAWGTFGSGSTNRILSNPANGAYIFTGTATGTTAQGMAWRLPSPTMPMYPRSLSFDPDTGDVYGRTGNWVTKAVRTGSNSADTPIALWSTYTGSNVLGQNLAFMSNTTNGDLVVFNERSEAGYLQTFVQSVTVIGADGTPQSVNWNFLTGTSSGYTTTTKSGWYDFSFDPVTQTLAVVQPETYRVAIFKMGSPDPSTQLRWAPTDGYVLGGDGTWDNSPATVWNGAYGPEAWNSGAQAYFGGTTYPTSSVTVAPGGVSVARGMSFVGNGYTIGGDSITLTGTAASVNNLYVDPGVSATVNTSITATSGLSKSGAGTLVVGGTVSGGALFINNGTLQIAPTASLQLSPGVTILSTGTLDLAGNSQTIRLLAGSGVVATGGGTLTIGANNASGTFAGVVAGTGNLVKTGNGTIALSGTNTLTGQTTVQGGRLQLANGSALGSSTVVPVAGGTMTLAPYLQATVGGLTPLAGGLTDVGSGMVTVAAGLSATDMVAALLTGLGDGSWNGASGITSSVAAASGGSRTVGWLDNGGGSVTFAFAAAGDTNLDWQVDILDSANFLSSGKLDSGLPASWIEGDFTYDGFVDVLDAAAFLSTGLLDAGPYNPPAAQVGVAAVPEPSATACCAMGVALAAGWFARRRRA